MGFRTVTLLIAPLLSATPAFGQQTEAADPVFNLPRSTQPQADSRQQGPELDVYRGAPTSVTPPPVVVVPNIAPPVAAPQAPAPEEARPVAPPAAPRTAAPARTEPQEAAQPAAPEPAQNAPAEAVAPSAPEVPRATPDPVPPLADAVERPAPQTEGAGSSLWIVGGLAAFVALLAAVILLRRRRGDDSEAAPESRAEQEGTAPPPPAMPVQPALRPVPAKPVPAERPQIELAMEVRNARLSLMGATIGYSLVLVNKGERTAEDILVRSLITNADAGQQDALKQFFAGQLGLPTHSVVSIAPGETTRLTGEMRLMPDQINPVQMGDRALLVPLLAFDVQYRWMGDQGELTGTGRVGRAFIAGQEKSPPSDRLAPFRLDLGPRQYRDPGSRATMLTLAS